MNSLPRHLDRLNPRGCDPCLHAVRRTLLTPDHQAHDPELLHNVSKCRTRMRALRLEQRKTVADRRPILVVEDALVQHGLIEDDSMVHCLSASWGSTPVATLRVWRLRALSDKVENRIAAAMNGQGAEIIEVNGAKR